jgi:hypothetical protein
MAERFCLCKVSAPERYLRNYATVNIQHTEIIENHRNNTLRRYVCGRAGTSDVHCRQQGFNCDSGADFSDVAAHTGSGDHPSSNVMDIEDSSPVGIAQYEAVLSPQIWCHHKECLMICLLTPIRVHGVALD